MTQPDTKRIVTYAKQSVDLAATLVTAATDATSKANAAQAAATSAASTDATTKVNAASATLATSIALRAPLASPAFTGTPTGITATHVGLGNVNNTSDANKPVSTAQTTAINTAVTTAATDAATKVQATYSALTRTPDALITGTITRDGNGAATSAPVTWPDGTAGTYTALVVSSAFPGAIDSYKITYGSPATKTYTQPTITRDGNGAAIAVPAITVT